MSAQERLALGLARRSLQVLAMRWRSRQVKRLDPANTAIVVLGAIAASLVTTIGLVQP